MRVLLDEQSSVGSKFVTKVFFASEKTRSELFNAFNETIRRLTCLTII